MTVTTRAIPEGVTITHPDKRLFDAPPITKGELASYYDQVAPVLLPHLRGRPLTLERYPGGIGGAGFLQKSVVRGVPSWLERITVPKQGGVVHHASATDRRSLQWIANQNTVTIHIWPSRTPSLSRPDLCVLDLDPPAPDAERLRAVMQVLREIVTRMRLDVWLKTSGSRGYHVVTPLGARSTFECSAALAERIASRLADACPEHVTREFRKPPRRPDLRGRRAEPHGRHRGSRLQRARASRRAGLRPLYVGRGRGRRGRPAGVHAARDPGAPRRGR